jgi:hypothetical protein
LTEPTVSVGQELFLSIGPLGGLGTSTARVLEAGADQLRVQTDGRLLFVRPGVQLQIATADGSGYGWARLTSADPDDERAVLVLESVRWSGESRQPRINAEYRTKVSYVESTDLGPRIRQAAGVTRNVSLSGSRMYVAKSLEIGDIYLIDFYLDRERVPEEEEAVSSIRCSAVARVVRCSAGMGEDRDGFDVAVHYLRFLSGLADYARIFAKPVEAASSEENEESEEHEEQAASEAA